MKKKIVYIAHPVKGDVARNLALIGFISRTINMNQPDVIPFVPYYLDCLILNDDIPQERHRGLSNGQTILKSGIVDEIWLYGNRVSEGMKEEVCVAILSGCKVQGKTPETRQWLQDNNNILTALITKNIPANPL